MEARGDLGRSRRTRRAAASPLEHLTLILCSDGVWELWEYEQVFEAIVSPPERSVQSTDKAKAFFEQCIVQGTEMVRGHGRQLTGVVGEQPQGHHDGEAERLPRRPKDARPRGHGGLTAETSGG